MICPCNCGRPVRDGLKYAAPGCWMRSPEGREHARKMGQRGGRTERMNLTRAAVIQKLAHLSREDAIWAAVQWAWRVERVRASRQRKAA